MGNFEKLSVLVIVVIIVMILVVALYTWTEKPSDEGTTAGTDGTALKVVSDSNFTPDPRPDGDRRIDPEPVPDAGTGEDEEMRIDLPEIEIEGGGEVGPDPIVIKDVEEVPAEEASGPWVYTVRKGDVFSVVCNRELGGYYKHLPALKQLNPGIDFDRIQIGQVINMPPRGADEPHTAGTLAGTAGTTPPGGGDGVPGGEYVVRQGESLKDIAKRVYGDWKVWTRIFAKNMTKITNPEYPTPGTRLTLPARR